MPTRYQLRDKQNEIADFIYNAMGTHDCSAIPTARQFADGLAAALSVMADKFGVDMTIDRYLTITKLAHHFNVSRYAMDRALKTCKIPGKTVAGTTRTTYSIERARQALQATGMLG